MEQEKSIYIALTHTHLEIDGEYVKTVSEDEIQKLKKQVYESEKLMKVANKLREKSEQSKRSAQKLLNRITMSHGITYRKDEAVGISKEDGTLYVGLKSRVTQNPELPPKDGDRIIGKITKYERRKYDELLEAYTNLAIKIDQHNQVVQENEYKLIEFEKSMLSEKEYDKEKQYLVVSSATGKVYLVTK